MSLVLSGTDLVVAVFLLMGLNGVFAVKPIPIIGIPLALMTGIIFFVVSVSLTPLNLILIGITLLLAGASLVTNIKAFSG